MTDLTAEQVADRCRSTWLASGISADSADEMTTELRSHLQEATAAGKSLDTVIGADIEAFAREWATEFMGPQTPAAPTEPTPPSLPRTDSRAGSAGLWFGALAIALMIGAVAVFGPKDDSLDQTLWTGVWFVAAAVLAVGEMITAGFFLLPFAVGASSAALLALAGVGIPLQLISFAAVSLMSLYVIQRFASKDTEGELIMVGAARYIGASAIVTGAIDRRSGAGSVRMGTESWRATSLKDAEIAVGTEVRVIEVSGVRLVVEPRNHES
jgi:membrane protein implicated in regulation of membrane protease activity